MTSQEASAALRAATARSEDEQLALLRAACRQAGVTLTGHRLRGVHHRQGRSVSHVHAARIEAGGEVRDVLLVTHVDTRPLPAGAHVVEHRGHGIAVWRFPHDPFLPGLPSAVHLDQRPELLGGLQVGRGPLRTRTRAYRPARRAVVEVSVRGRRVGYLKVLSGRRAARLADRHRQLADHLPVPRVAGVAPEEGILALAPLPGRTLRDALTSRAPLPEPEAIVALSRRLMASGLVSDRSPRAFADPRRHVARLCELAPEAAATVRRVAAAASEVGGPAAVVHGDLHAGQLLVEDGQVTGLLDVDGAGTGLLAQDAGSLVAYLQVLGELHPASRPRIDAYAERVAAAYAPLVGQRALTRAVAGTWLALATAPHRSQRPGWPEATRARIARAAAALDG